MAGWIYLISGKIYDFLDEHSERTRYKKIREKILKNLKGKILDAGCGTGRNFPYYRKSAYILAVDNSEAMLKVARKRAENLSNINIRQMNLTQLELPDNSMNNVVATFVLCTMPKRLEIIALNELVRVAKPNARLYFLEYDYPQNLIKKFVMRVTSFIPKLLYGVRLDSILPVLKEEKRLTIEKNEFVYGDILRMIVARKRHNIERFKKLH